MADTGAPPHSCRRCCSPPRCGSHSEQARQALAKPRSSAGTDGCTQSRWKSAGNGATAYSQQEQSVMQQPAHACGRGHAEVGAPSWLGLAASSVRATRWQACCTARVNTQCCSKQPQLSTARCHCGFCSSVRHGLKKPQALHQPAAASVVHGMLWHAWRASQQATSLGSHAPRALAYAVQLESLHLASFTASCSCPRHAQLPVQRRKRARQDRRTMPVGCNATPRGQRGAQAGCTHPRARTPPPLRSWPRTQRARRTRCPPSSPAGTPTGTRR
jgi:hypothetical protein